MFVSFASAASPAFSSSPRQAMVASRHALSWLLLSLVILRSTRTQLARHPQAMSRSIAIRWRALAAMAASRPSLAFHAVRLRPFSISEGVLDRNIGCPSSCFISRALAGVFHAPCPAAEDFKVRM